MNRIHRHAWNQTPGLCQVVWEQARTARGGTGGSGRGPARPQRRHLSWACAVALLGMSATSALWAAPSTSPPGCTVDGVTYAHCGADGGNGSNGTINAGGAGGKGYSNPDGSISNGGKGGAPDNGNGAAGSGLDPGVGGRSGHSGGGGGSDSGGGGGAGISDSDFQLYSGGGGGGGGGQIGQVVSNADVVASSLGGRGGHGGGGVGGQGGNGGGGDGAWVIGSDFYVLRPGKTVTGGTGGSIDSHYYPVHGAAGGRGGDGIRLVTDNVVFRNEGRVDGGNGGISYYEADGDGGDGVFFAGTGLLSNTVAGHIAGGNGVGLRTGGAGSNGGNGVTLTGDAGANSFVTNAGTITGGYSAHAATTGGNGGNGGNGVMASYTTVTNSGSIVGGHGDGRGDRNKSNHNGAGGDAVRGDHLTIINSGTLTGGAADRARGFSGVGGTNGAAVAGSSITLTNSGTLTGGGNSQIDAVRFTGGSNTLALEKGYSITGHVLANASDDTLALSGADNAGFDVSGIGPSAQYRGFEHYRKTGTSTWTLTGTTTAKTPWTIDAGTLSISSNGNLGDDSGTLTFNGGTLETTKVLTTARNITLKPGGGTFQTASHLTASGTISGAGSLTKTGSGTLTLNGVNTYTGGTTIDAGTLSISSTANLGDGSGTLSFNGGTLETTKELTTARDIALKAGGGTFQTASQLTVAGTISGSGTLAKTGSGTLMLSGNNTYKGGTTIDAGTLSISSTTNLGDGSGTLTFDGGTLETTTALTTARDITLKAGGGTLHNASHLTVSGTISGAGSLTKTGSGTLTLEGINTYSGGTTLQAGTLLGNTSSMHGAITDNAMLSFDQVSDGTFAGVVSGRGMLVKTGSGTLTLRGDNTYTGGTTVDAGTLQGNAASLQGAITDNATLAFDQGSDGTFAGVMSGSGTLTKTGSGTLTLNGVNTYTGGTTIDAGTLQGTTASLHGAITDNATLAFDQGSDGTFAGVISGDGTLAKTGAGTVTLSGDNTYTGGTTIDAGTLSISSSGNLGDHSGTLSFDGGTLETTTVLTSARDITLKAGGGTFQTASHLTASGTISGAGSLTKTGSGTLTLNGVNTYTGGTTIDAGTLSISSTANLGDGSGALSFNGGTLETTKELTTARDIALKAGGGTLHNALQLTLPGTISGTGSLTKTGSGTLTLSGDNTYTGGTTIAAGTLQGTAASLHGAITDNATLAFDQSSDGTFSGAVSGSGTLAKTGAGTLVFNAVNPFNGTTTVHAGTLIVGDDGHADAALGGMVTVNRGAVLCGFGTVKNLDLAGTLAPGHSIGTLHVAGDATFRKGSIYQIEATTDGHGDRLDVAGTLSIQGASATVLAQAGNWSPWTKYTIIDAGGGVSGQFESVSANLAFLTPKLSYGAHSVNLVLERNDIDLTKVAQTGNQHAVAAAANPLGFGNPLYDSVVKLDAPTARAAFDQLSGEIHADTQREQFAASRTVRTGMEQHLLNTVDSASGGLWARASGHWGDADANINAAHLKANGSSLLAGADTVLRASGVRIGAMVGDSQTSLNADARRSTAHLRSTWGGLYAGTHRGAWRLRGGAAYAWTRIKSTRHVVIPQLQQTLAADGHGHTAQAFVEGGWSIATKHGHLEPYLNLAEVQVRSGGRSEHGGAAALHTSGQHDNLGFGTLGLRGTWQLGTADHAIAMHGGVGWRHAFGTTTISTQLRFANGTRAFTVDGLPVAQNAASVDFGLRFAIGHRWQVDAAYHGQFASRSRDQGARMQVTYTF